jgi:hypothetical protein
MCTVLKIKPDCRNYNARSTFTFAPDSRSHDAILQNAQPPLIEITFSRAFNQCRPITKHKNSRPGRYIPRVQMIEIHKLRRKKYHKKLIPPNQQTPNLLHEPWTKNFKLYFENSQFAPRKNFSREKNQRSKIFWRSFRRFIAMIRAFGLTIVDSPPS